MSETREKLFQTVREALQAAIKADRQWGWILECTQGIEALAALEAEERESPKHVAGPVAPPAAECNCGPNPDVHEAEMKWAEEEAKCWEANFPGGGPAVPYMDHISFPLEISNIHAELVATKKEIARLKELLEIADRKLQVVTMGRFESAYIENAAELRQAVDALRQIQWGNPEIAALTGRGGLVHLCPMCDQVESHGHSPDCYVGASIAAYDEKHGK